MSQKEMTPPKRLVSDPTPPLINICVEEKDKGQTADYIPRVFQAACLFNQATFGMQQEIKRAEIPHVYMPSNESEIYSEGPGVISGGFNSQIDEYSMAPILEDESLVKEISRMESEQDQPAPKSTKEFQINCEALPRQASKNSDQLIQLQLQKNTSSRTPPAPGTRKTIQMATLNLDNIISEQMTGIKEPTTKIITKDAKADFPPMSSRRIQQNMPTQQELAIENKVLEICSSSVTQPIFQAIWKVILSLCFDTKSLKSYMVKQNLITVPIRAIHYHEILCLFRKAHGPILQIKKVDETANPMRYKKKASLITAKETVQGFASYKNFCRDVVQMLGDGVLLLNPDLYTIVVQLIFESISIQTKTKTNEDVIYLRRITDISSPFQTPMTDNLPVQRIFTFSLLDQVVKLFCMREIFPAQLIRLTERRFIPQSLATKDFKAPPGEQVFDQLDKVLQHSYWKESRSETASRLQGSKSPQNDRSPDQSKMKKISHMSKKHQKVISIPYSSQKSEVSEQTSEKGSINAVENYSSLQPKLAIQNRDRMESPLNIEGSQRSSCSPQALHPSTKIEAVKPVGEKNTQFHIMVGNSVPRTPQAQVRQSYKGSQVIDASKTSQLTINEQQTINLTVGRGTLDDQFSFQQRVSKFQSPVVQERGRLSVISRISKGDQERQKPQETLKLMDLMHKNHKYRKLAAKTKELNHQSDLLELQQFGVHRSRFNKLRATDREFQQRIDQGNCESSSNDGQFHVKINSKGKLEELRIIQTIEEIKEVGDDDTGQKQTGAKKDKAIIEILTSKTPKIKEEEIQQTKSVKQELFDLKPLLLKNGILRIHKSNNQQDWDDDISISSSMQDTCDFTFQQQVDQKMHFKTKDFLNQQKTFNRQNLQLCKRKNKLVIANNQQKQNDLMIQKGYQTCLFTGKRLGQSTKNQRRRQKSYAVAPSQIPKIYHEQPRFPPSTDRQAAKTFICGANYQNIPHNVETPMFNSTKVGTRLLSPQFEPPSQQNESDTLEGYIMSLQIINSGGFNSTTFSPTTSTKPASRGSVAQWGGMRRASNPYSCGSRLASMGPSANSQRIRLRSIGSSGHKPDSSDVSRRTAAMIGSGGRTAITANYGCTTNAGDIDQQGSDLGDAIFCRTIPKLVQEFQSRLADKEQETLSNPSSPTNIPAVPIHLHLTQAGMATTPPSVHAVMKDSLMAMSREESVSREQPPTQTMSRTEREDDGICTIRAESRFDGSKTGTALEVALRQANIQDDSNGIQPYSTPNGNKAKFLMIPPKIQLLQTQKQLSVSKPQAQSQLQQKYPRKRQSNINTKWPGGFTSIAVETTMKRRVSDVMCAKELQSVGIMVSMPTASNDSGILADKASGQNEFQQPDLESFDPQTKLQKETQAEIMAEYQTDSPGRGRMNTADHLIRNKMVQQRDTMATEVGKKVVTSKRKQQPKRFVTQFLNEDVDNNIDMNFGDHGLWQKSIESPGNILNNSDTMGIQGFEQGVQAHISEATSSSNSNGIKHNYPHQKVSESSIELKILTQPEKLIESAQIDLVKQRTVQLHDKNYQKGEFIAPRQVNSRKFQKLSIKTPINLLSLHDYKGVKNINLTVCNQDLNLNSNRFETETMNLSYTKSIRTPDRRQRNLTQVSLAARRQPRENMTTIPMRTPTPIKIVDLSANPGDAPLSGINQCGMTLRQEYAHFDSHFPLLNNRSGTRTLKQEFLRKATAGMRANQMMSPLLGSTMSPLEPPSPTVSAFKNQLTAMTTLKKPTANIKAITPQISSPTQANKQKQKQREAIGQELDLRSMIGFLVRSPVAPFSARNIDRPY